MGRPQLTRTLAWPSRVLIGLLLVGGLQVHARDLSFEERVAAQRTIEQVYYAHRIGSERSFEEAVPQELLQRKVRKYLRQSVALQERWGVRVAGEALERERVRMSGSTRMPDRLREIHHALDDDGFLFQECFVRPVLVDRLARNFFAFDRRIHDAVYEAAERVRSRLASRDLDTSAEHPNRRVVEVVRVDHKMGLLVPASMHRTEMEPHEYASWRSRAPRDVGQVGPVQDDPSELTVTVIQAENGDRTTVAVYRFPKVSWETWWSEVEGELDEKLAHAVAAEWQDHPVRPWPDRGDDRQPKQLFEGISSCPDGDTWDNGLLDNRPAPRYQHTAVWTGSEVIVWGGFGYIGEVFDAGGRYDPVTDSWTPTSISGAPPARLNHTAVWTGEEMLVWGGWDEEFFETSTGGSYDPAADQWTAMPTTNAPSPRVDHTAIWTGSEMVVWGGGLPPGVDTGGRFDPTTSTWTRVSTAGAPAARTDHTAVWTGSEMIVWGGFNNGGDLDTGGRYDPAADSWEPISSVSAPIGRTDHTAVWTGSQMIVWGGGFLGTDTGGRYDPVRDVWTPTALNDAPSARATHAAVWTGGQMIVWGGGLKSFDFDAPVDTGGIYTPSTDSWTPTTTTNAPVQRMVPTAVWTGDVMIVWGGHFGIDEGGCCIGYYNSGGRYDPATDAWTPTSRQDGPEGHWGHTAVWTGSRMIVWGGRKGPNLDVDTGARYDPVSDSWTPTSTLGTPLRRALHAGVWTGDEMIVWGGVTPDIIGEVPTNTGARYDPLTDSWTPTPTAGAPLPRARSTAVWTGQEMIVWGGLGIGNLQLNTGGRYDPASNAWTRTSTTSAPTGRAQHTVAWTGKEMIVWGGFTPTATNSGGRYDPLTDSWIPTPVALAPAARGAHTAVWTGNEMIVWGGLDVDLMNTGGRYDTTLLDGWIEPPSSIDAPAPRALHTAVWTGNEMIVWGGIVGDLGPVPPSVTNTGGRYEADADAWVPTSTIAAPKATASHSAMWTGSTMIVWGGSVTGSSGGRYVANLSTDADLDGFCDYLDCDDSNDQVWATPGEALDLVFVDDLTLSWNVPSTPGGLSLVYDTLRSTDASDFVTGSDCLEQDDGSDTEALDADAPVSGGVFYYLIRAENACPFGLGSMGASSDDSPRTGRSCP